MPTRADDSLASCIRAWKEARQALSPKTLFHESWQVERLRSFLSQQRVRSTRHITHAHLIAYLRTYSGLSPRTGRPYSPGTVRTARAVFRVFFRFLVKSGRLLRDPSAEIRLPRWKPLPKHVLSEAQARRLVAHPLPNTPFGHRDCAVLEILYGTGLRVAECVRLDLQDVDLGAGVLLVRLGKGRKDRLVPLAGRARLALDLYLREGRPSLVRDSRETALFLSHRGRRRLGVPGIQQVVVKHARAAGIPFRCAPHALRHTCATHLIKGGADVRHVQQILGHRDLRSTQIYTRVEMSDVRRMLERSHPRERRRGRKDGLSRRR